MAAPATDNSIRDALVKHEQAHLLSFYDELDELAKRRLMGQLAAINWDGLDALIDEYVRNPQPPAIPQDIEPAPYYGCPHERAVEYDVEHFRNLGGDLVAAGQVAAFTVAGGQGTRLGWNGPKGTFPATPITGKPLFRVFAEQILAAQKKYKTAIPWYIMTSPINDAETRAFFADNNYFGLDARNIFMFPQGVMPSIDAATGRLLLAAKDELAVNPDGHGGSIKALRESGAIDDMVNRGVTQISYFQVDNPLAKVIDPLFLGLHAAAPDSSAEMSSKMVPKASPEEKVGVFCTSNGKTMVIEYSDLPEELAQQRDEAGKLRFNAGSIAIHIFGVEFVARLTEDVNKFGLPWHRAIKKVPYIDITTGKLIEPQEPNAVKLEAFVFDALPLAESSIVLETSRIEEFAPIKNAEGVDSPATSHEIQTQRSARWLEAAGVRVPRENDRIAARIEISPLTALEPADLQKAELPAAINAGADVVI